MNMRWLLILCSLALFVPGVAAQETLVIEDITPDSDNRLRDARITAFAFSNKTETYTFNGSVMLPNGTEIPLGGQTFKINSDTARDLVFTLEEQFIDSYGEYLFIVEETALNENNDTFLYTIAPEVRNVLSPRSDEIVLDNGLPQFFVDLNADAFTPRQDEVLFNRIRPGDVEVFNVTADGTTTDRFFQTDDFFKDNDTEVTTVAFNKSRFSPGVYRVQVNYTIFSPDNTHFIEDATATLTIKGNESQNALDSMAAMLAVILSLLGAAGLFMYAGIRMEPDTATLSVVKVFFFLLSPLFLSFTVFAAFQSAQEQSLAAAGWMDFAFLGTFMVFFAVAFIVGVVFYVNEAFRVSVLGKRRVDSGVG